MTQSNPIWNESLRKNRRFSTYSMPSTSSVARHGTEYKSFSLRTSSHNNSLLYQRDSSPTANAGQKSTLHDNLLEIRANLTSPNPETVLQTLIRLKQLVSQEKLNKKLLEALVSFGLLDILATIMKEAHSQDIELLCIGILINIRLFYYYSTSHSSSLLFSRRQGLFWG